MSTYLIIINPLSSYMKMLNIILYSCLKYNSHILHIMYYIYVNITYIIYIMYYVL